MAADASWGTPTTLLCPAFLSQVICAGSRDSFQIFVWSLKTGRLLEVLAAHEGPVVALQFCPGAPLLGSASWDK
jgi:periodic tryptophan protein 2